MTRADANDSAEARTPREWDVALLGGINSDYLVAGDRLPGPGETVTGERFHEGPGGKGANQAVAAARLGASVAMIGRVGDDLRGSSLIASLLIEGVTTDFITRSRSAATGGAVIMVDGGGEKQIMAAAGANAEVGAREAHDADEVIRRSRILLMQLETSMEAVVTAAGIAAEGGVRVLLDTAPAAPLPTEIYPMLHVIRSNAAEATALTGIDVTTIDEARRAAELYRLRGAAVAIVQAGEYGDLVLHEGGELFLQRIPVPIVDATGAGDAFMGALSAELARGIPLGDALHFANAAAAHATTSFGAQGALPRRSDVLELLRMQGDGVGEASLSHV